MNQELQNRAKSIQQMLTVHPLSGADLLMDFARQYAANKDLENKVILLKLDYNELVEAKETVVDGETANTKQQRTAEIETELTSIISQLAALADEVVQDYNPEAVQGVLQREKELAQEIQQQEIPEKVILSINSIRKTYKSTNFQLQTGDLQFHLGEVIGLVGENATGKTTLFRILAGDLKHDKGELSYPLFQTSKRLNWLALKAQIAYVPQALPKWHGTLLENLKYEAAIHGIKGEDNRKAVEYIIQRLGLAEHIEKSWQQLSGGYKLRFALAKALVWKPQLLILDEPLANLDIRTQIVVLNDLQNLAKSLRHPMTVLLSSQHLHEVEAIADRMLFMRAGKLTDLGITSEYANERPNNTFEINCDLNYTDLVQAMEGFAYEKIWFNGMSYLITTARTVSGFELLAHLAQQHIQVRYYRDISQSIKTKFYEAYL